MLAYERASDAALQQQCQQRARCVERELWCVRARARARAREIDGANWLSPITFIRLKGLACDRSLRFFSTFLCSFRCALSLSAIYYCRYCAEAVWRRVVDRGREGSARGRPDFVRSSVIKSRGFVRYIFFFLDITVSIENCL